MPDLSVFRPKAVPKVPDQTKEFLSHFPGHTTITTVSQASEVDGRQIVVSYDAGVNANYEYIQTSNKNGHDVYFTVNETSSAGRKAHDIESIRAIFADDDKPRPQPRTDWALTPSIIVCTSTHPTGSKYHYYWITTTTVVDEWERVMEGIVQKYDTDIAVKDLARLLRVPGYSNNKHGTPSKCYVEESNDIVYQWDTIKKHFPPVTQAERKTTNPSKAGEEFNSYDKETQFKLGEHISDPLNSLISHWANHYSADNIRRKVDQLMEQVPADIRELHQQRYYSAYVQVNKWINSAKTTVANRRATTQVAEVLQMPKKARALDSKTLVDFTPIPKDSVPDCIHEAATEMGRFLANGTEPSLISAMSIACALLGKNVKIHEMGADTTTYCSSGIVIAMETGTRKTQVYKHLSKPFTDYEKIIQDEWEKDKTTIEASAILYAEKAKHLEQEMKKAVQKDMSKGEEKALIMRMASVKNELNGLQTHKPTLHIKDVTEEEVITKMHQNQGSMAVVSDDSRNIIKNVLGRYGNDNTAEGWIIDGMGGTDIKYNRAKNGGTEYTIHDPCLNLYLMVQPDMAIKFKDHEVYRHSGLAARVPVYFYPIDPLDIVKNSDRSRRLRPEKMEAYYKAMRELCVRRPESPMIVELSTGAEDRFNAFNGKFLKLLMNEWKGEYKKTNKIITQAVIMATVTAAMDDPDFRMKFQTKPELDVRYTLTAKHANMGCMYVEALYEGMIRSTDSLDNIEIAEVATRFAASVLRAYETGKIYEGFINTSHLQNSFKMINKDNRHAVIDMLIDFGWLSVTKADEYKVHNNGFPGGKSTPGDVVLHMNVKEVEKLLRIKRLQDEASVDAKGYKPHD
jgi:hypothetical protein